MKASTILGGRRSVAFILAWSWLFVGSLAWARTSSGSLGPSDRARFDEAARALVAHEPTRAIDILERLADHGVTSPDLGFNRGVAYLERSESALAEPGDLGQAAAAFAEALSLDPEDGAAAAGLEEARLRVARRRAHAGDAAVVDTEPLLLRALGLLSGHLLFWIAAAGSLLATLGLSWRIGVSAQRRLAATIVAALGALILVTAAAGEWARVHYLVGTTSAVVVTERASLLDQAGRPISKSPALAEGQSVVVREFQGRLARLVTNSGDLWVLSTTLRALPRHEP